MILPQTYPLVLALMILSLLCLGSWASLFKMAGKWRFELFYFDFALGLIVGTGLGVTTGTLFIPFLQIKSEAHAGIPKFVVMTAWNDITKIYVLFGIILAIAFPAFIWMLARMKIHEAIKFGEETG